MSAPRSHVILLAFIALPGLATSPDPAHAAQSYDNCAGFIDSLPATISTQGVWCLRHDLSTNIASGNAIEIAANNVTIDCNDFKIGGLAAGDASQANGIYAGTRQNAAIRHCNIRGFYYGIDIDGGGGHLLEDNRLDNNLRYGIYVSGENNLVQRNRVYDTGGAPNGTLSVAILSYGNVVENDVNGVFATATNASVTGIYAFGPVARGNRISSLTPNGNGYAAGISGYLNILSAIDNQVFAGTYSTNGTGINSAHFCMGNTVTSFTTAYDCVSVAGNLP